jgi:hypothetical protein
MPKEVTNLSADRQGKGKKTMLPRKGRPHARRFFRPTQKEELVFQVGSAIN